jgi:3-oxoacyl-[acyl-carrier protein] reductase
MNNLEKKNIIVTGASGGIGNAIIKKLYESWSKYFSFRD